MPRDTPPPPKVSALPGWLTPGLIAALASAIEADVAAGRGQQAAALAFERARALHPALPTPDLRDAVAIASWVAHAPGTDE